MESKPPTPPVARLNPNASPKARFISNPRAISEHRQMVDSAAFSVGCDSALLQYQVLLSEQTKDGNTAMANGFKMQGATEVIAILKTISESSPIAPRRTTENLDHSQ